MELQIKLDWLAYFREFCNVHGGDPVHHAGRLLFRDGWTYSATDHAGPEFPPPESDPQLVKHLKYQYWNIRRQAIRQELEQLKSTIGSLEEMQRSKSAPLQQVVISYDDKGKPRRGAQPLDIAPLKIRLDLLEHAMVECLNELSNLIPANAA